MAKFKILLSNTNLQNQIFSFGENNLGDDKEKKELSDRAVEAIERIRWLVTGMLQIAKLESGAYRMESYCVV